MKKEVIIAIIIGISIGLALTFFFYKTGSFKSDNKIVSPLAEEKNFPTPPPFPPQTLSIISPIDQSIVKEGKIAITGIAVPFSWIVAFGEKGEKMIQADNKGSFETDLLLVSGENEIKITSFSDRGDEISKTVTIVYSTAEI